MWSSGQSSWLRIQSSGFDSRRYQMFWELVGLERSPLSLVSTVAELLERKSSGSDLENWEYDRRYLLRWSRHTLYPQNLALNWRASGCRSVGVVRSRTEATEFSWSYKSAYLTLEFITIFITSLHGSSVHKTYAL
jgi:hypothetical protein